MPIIRKDKEGIYIISDGHVVRSATSISIFEENMNVKAFHHEGSVLYSVYVDKKFKETWYGNEYNPEVKRKMEGESFTTILRNVWKEDRKKAIKIWTTTFPHLNSVQVIKTYFFDLVQGKCKLSGISNGAQDWMYGSEDVTVCWRPEVEKMNLNWLNLLTEEEMKELNIDFVDQKIADLMKKIYT